MDVYYDVINDVSWSAEENGRIFKFNKPVWERPNLSFFMCYSPWNFGDTWSQDFLWTSITTLLVVWVGLEGQTNTFQVQTSPNSARTEILPFSCANFRWYRIPTCFWPIFFMNFPYDLINDMIWFRGANERIFNFKQTQMCKRLNLSFFVWYNS